MKKVILLSLLFLSTTFAQSVVDDFDESSGNEVNYELVDEEILNISLSKKIYLVSNRNETYSRGDFISFLIDKKLVARGLVARVTGQVSAVKITKIYSLEMFKTFKKKLIVQIIRGDDSYYRIKKEKKDDPKVAINDEDDLFDESNILEDDDEFDGLDSSRKNDIIKNDNIVTVGVALVDGYDEGGNEAKNQQIHASWAYQLEKNIFIEGMFGQHLIKDFPTTGLDTQVRSYTVRAKYAFKAPFYSVIMPYVGFRMVDAESPGAGVASSTQSNASELAKEVELVENLKDKGPVFGVTVLKRLVPGWFIRGEVGNDVLAAGLALEF